MPYAVEIAMLKNGHTYVLVRKAQTWESDKTYARDTCTVQILIFPNVGWANGYAGRYKGNRDTEVELMYGEE